MLIRKFYALLIMFALLLSQAGAVLHHAQHLSEHTSIAQNSDDQNQHSSPTSCEQCIQFDLFENGLTPAPLSLIAVKFQSINTQSVQIRFNQALLQPYSARAPPRFT